MTSALASLAAAAISSAATARGASPTLIEQKGVQDFVTDMDRRLQRAIASELKVHFPGVPCFGEEDIADDAHLPDEALLIDPLDGTGNWISGLPFAAVSIAYLEQGATVLAAVASISDATIYTAQAGKGAWRNGERLALKPPPELMVLSTGALDAIAGTRLFAELRRFGKLRNLGSQALHLCAVASGSLAFVASVEARLWDDAAGSLIATEAGARYAAGVEAFDRDRPAAYQRSLCAQPGCFDAVAELLRPVFHPGRTE